MNNKDEQADDYRSLLLLDEISKNNELTQRDLSKRLGVALGLINSYIKNLASKGYITVSTIPRQRYKYYLTPQGFTEKTRLTYQHLQNFTSLYRVARKDFHTLFNHVRNSKIKKVAFCGVDEVTEIAYLSLKEAGLELAGIIDRDKKKKKFLGFDIRSFKDIGEIDYEVIIITSFQGGEDMKKGLMDAGVCATRIFSISPGGWLNKDK